MGVGAPPIISFISSVDFVHPFIYKEYRYLSFAELRRKSSLVAAGVTQRCS